MEKVEKEEVHSLSSHAITVPSSQTPRTNKERQNPALNPRVNTVSRHVEARGGLVGWHTWRWFEQEEEEEEVAGQVCSPSHCWPRLLSTAIKNMRKGGTTQQQEQQEERQVECG